MSYTCQSETGKIKSVYIKRAADAFIDEETMRGQWEALHFLDKPALGNAMAEYEVFESLLGERGVEIHRFPQDPQVNMDSIYCRDAAIATDHGIILCNMGKPARAHEPAAQRKVFKAAGL